MRYERQYFVYMIASLNRHALYIGVTNNLIRRVLEHKHGAVVGFTKLYHCVDLVWYDVTDDVAGAIEAEKRIKKWRRSKKNTLIETINPNWLDLTSQILDGQERGGRSLAPLEMTRGVVHEMTKEVLCCI
ncbi:MAG: GIY-YIG nuclease family protein [Patescibacteria group bacterium]